MLLLDRINLMTCRYEWVLKSLIGVPLVIRSKDLGYRVSSETVLGSI